jgi:hypothetical protein
MASVVPWGWGARSDGAGLVRLASLEAALDLRLGEGFARLAAVQGWRHLGHSRPADHAMGGL